MQFNMTEAKAQLSKLGELAWQGEEVVIAKAGKPYLLLKPFRDDLTPRKPGAWKGKVKIVPDSDDDLTPRELGAWKGKVRIGPDFDDDQDIIDSFYSSKIFPDEKE